MMSIGASSSTTAEASALAGVMVAVIRSPALRVRTFTSPLGEL
jgi:hypothetical protein